MSGPRSRALALAIASAACGGPSREPFPVPPSPKGVSVAPAPAALLRDAGPKGDRFTDLVVDGSACTATPKLLIARDEALADLAVVERVVREGWAGYDTRTNEGVDFAAAFGRVRSFVASTPEPLVTEAFQDAVLDALAPAADNHLALSWPTARGSRRWKATGRSLRAYTADLVVVKGLASGPPGSKLPTGVFAGCLATDDSVVEMRPTLTRDLAPAARPIVLSAGKPAAIVCSFRSPLGTVTAPFELRPLVTGVASTSTNPETVYESRSVHGVPVSVLRSFWSGNATPLESFAASAVSLRDQKALVADVRGNGGGSDDYARRFFGALTRGPLPYGRIERLDTEVTRQGQLNDNTCQLARGLEDAAARSMTLERLERTRGFVAEAKRGGVPFRHVEPRVLVDEGTAPKPFTAPIVVVTDGRCASACESFVALSRNLPGTVVIGSNTAGTGVFGEVLPYRLPNSGLTLTAGSKRFEGPDPTRSLVEGRGYLPDYWVDDPDPVALAGRLATCLAKPTCAAALRSR